MINCDDLHKIFQDNGINFFTGVPDSTFKGWMSYLDDFADGKNLFNIIASNECEATAISAGYHLATGNTAVVYMQNSGEGKTVNPLTSLCDKEVYSVPMILMIGWRGEPGKKDEPQHKKMGKVTLSLLETLGIPYEILPDNVALASQSIKKMTDLAIEDSSPVAIIVKEGVVATHKTSNVKESEEYLLTREQAIKTVVDCLSEDDLVISTTGKTSRELFEHRATCGQPTSDFYTVGSMGCSAAIGFGVSLQTLKNVFIFDGDGAMIMQMGTLSGIGHYKPKNLFHIIFNNHSYDSTGGQPTVASSTNFADVAKACGYKDATTISAPIDIKPCVTRMMQEGGPQLLVINVNKGAREDLGRPTTTPMENKKLFMEKVKNK